MKTTMSVLVSGLSGSSGDVVASRARGQSYVRRRVIPKYTNTVEQAAVRANLSRMPRWWRSLPGPLAELMKLRCVGESLSAFNRVSKACLTAMNADVPYPPPLIEGMGKINNVQVTGFVPGAGPDCSIKFSPGAAPLTNYAVGFAIPVEAALENKEEPDVVVFSTPVLVSELEVEIGLAWNSKDYWVGVMVIDKATFATAENFSDAVVGLVTSVAP